MDKKYDDILTAIQKIIDLDDMKEYKKVEIIEAYIQVYKDNLNYVNPNDYI